MDVRTQVLQVRRLQERYQGLLENGQSELDEIDQKGLFKYDEERSIVCNCTDDEKINFEGFTQMVAMATSYTLLRS